MDADSCKIEMNSFIEDLPKFREQALCIKTNLQILFDVWELNPHFKEKRTGCFYRIIQEDCIFRIVIETHRMLYDNGSKTIKNTVNRICKQIKEKEKVDNRICELKDRS